MDRFILLILVSSGGHVKPLSMDNTRPVAVETWEKPTSGKLTSFKCDNDKIFTYLVYIHVLFFSNLEPSRNIAPVTALTWNNKSEKIK